VNVSCERFRHNGRLNLIRLAYKLGFEQGCLASDIRPHVVCRGSGNVLHPVAADDLQQHQQPQDGRPYLGAVSYQPRMRVMKSTASIATNEAIPAAKSSHHHMSRCDADIVPSSKKPRAKVCAPSSTNETSAT
jgi:hypothetical protein